MHGLQADYSRAYSGAYSPWLASAAASESWDTEIAHSDPRYPNRWHKRPGLLPDYDKCQACIAW